MPLVVDASVGVKWLVPEEGSDIALRLFQSEEELHVPRLFAAEIANAVWRKARVGELEEEEAGKLILEVREMPVRWHADETFCVRAFQLALAHKRPVYDYMYLALAQQLDTRVITADQRFANALAGTLHGDFVVTMDDLSSRG